jgi:hypothetical protein
VAKHSEESARERRQRERAEAKEQKQVARRAKYISDLTEAGVLREDDAGSLADQELSKRWFQHTQEQHRQRMREIKQRSSLHVLGIKVKQDGTVCDMTWGRRLGLLAGARAEVTDPSRRHRGGAAVSASLLTMGMGLGPTGAVVGLSKKSVAVAIIVFPDGSAHQHRLDGAGAVQQAQAAAVTFNAMAQAAAGQASPIAGEDVARLHEDGQASAFVADEIRKLADLRASGILTDEEFEAKKQQLLGL